MFHKTMQYGGVTIEYSGSNDAVERINSSKPLTRQLYIEVIIQKTYNLYHIIQIAIHYIILKGVKCWQLVVTRS